MATNIKYKPGYELSVEVTDPSAPVTGDPVRYGALTGLALTDEGEGGNDSTHTSVDFGPFIADISVVDEVGGGIAVGDPIYYDDAIHGLNNDAVNGYFFGTALEVIGAGLTDTILVMHTPSPGAGAYAALGVTTAKLANGAVTEAKIDPASLTGLVAKVVADTNVIGGIPVLHRINVAGGAAGNTDVVLTHKTRIIDAWAVHTGGAGEASDTLQVKNGANAITDAMAWNGADGAIVRAASLDDAYHEVAAGGTLRVTTTDNDAGDDVGAGTVYVLGIRVS